MGDTLKAGQTVAQTTVNDPEHDAAKDREMPVPKSTKSPAFQFYQDRFQSRIDKSGDCWLWIGALDKDGYGIFYAGRTVRAHRFAFEHAFGWLPAGGVIMHKCDTPRCVNPSHLCAGTTEDNVRDKIRKGRLRVPHGSEHWSRRLSIEQIRQAREAWASGTFTQVRLAAFYGVSPATMNRALRQLAWEERNV